MTLGNMRHLGVHRLVAYCLNPSCRRCSPNAPSARLEMLTAERP
jgi:hypothetical protein